jgi:hypothetical protein
MRGDCHRPDVDSPINRQSHVNPKPQVKDQYGRTVARVTCNGVDANAEQVNRGMAWVYRRYAKDHDLYVLEHGAKAASAGYGLILLLLHLGNGEKTAMCGRFEQSETPRYYADALHLYLN